MLHRTQPKELILLPAMLRPLISPRPRNSSKESVTLNSKVLQMVSKRKLLGFIKDNTDPCTDKECWFTMDRLVFQTGSSDLDMNFSADQLNNVYQIMSAYPNIQLKVGGYTDNTGSEDLNLRLSKQRADTVVSALVALGLEEDRFNAEGFGPAHPIATNDTPEGRAQNRRIDVRVRSNTFGEE